MLKTSSISALDFPRPLTTVDVVILAIQSAELHVLLVKRPSASAEPFPSKWALPGGFVDIDKDESLEDCALRKLKEKTPVSTPYLEQVGSWGNAKRDPRGWSATHVYAALLAPEVINNNEANKGAEYKWELVRANDVQSRLAFDHNKLLQASLVRVRAKAEYTSLPIHLLPNEFTLTELQWVYEIVLGRPLEKKAFRTRMLASELLTPIDAVKATSRRPAQLYTGSGKKELIYFARTFEQPRIK